VRLTMGTGVRDNQHPDGLEAGEGVYVTYSIKNQPFPATKVIYNINIFYTVFLINLMLF
jgi:hypothetical protein